MFQIVKPLGKPWPSILREIKFYASPEILGSLPARKVLVPRTLGSPSKVPRVVSEEEEEEQRGAAVEGRQGQRKREERGRERILPITAALE